MCFQTLLVHPSVLNVGCFLHVYLFVIHYLSTSFSFLSFVFFLPCFLSTVSLVSFSFLVLSFLAFPFLPRKIVKNALAGRY